MSGIAACVGSYDARSYLNGILQQIIEQRPAHFSGYVPVMSRRTADSFGIAYAGDDCEQACHGGSIDSPSCYCVLSGQLSERFTPTLRRELEMEGYCFTTNSDAEIVAHLFDGLAPENPSPVNCLYALRDVLSIVHGSYSVALIACSQSSHVFLATKNSGLHLNHDGTTACSSDLPFANGKLGWMFSGTKVVDMSAEGLYALDDFDRMVTIIDRFPQDDFVNLGHHSE